MPIFVEAAAILMDIEAELRRLGLWQAEPPAPAALASTEPFSVDTLSLSQWLQFVFIPRMHALMEAGQLPPGRCEVHPMAEEQFRNGGLDMAPLLQHLAKLDALINAAPG